MPASASLRTRLMNTASVEDIVGIENRAAIFPIHRSMKFVLLSATSGATTQSIHCRFGISRLHDLENESSAPARLHVSRQLLERVSGADDLSLPELTDSRDLVILEAVTAAVPMLADPAGWHARFGRELNATDDRGLMVPCSHASAGRPVIEGKFISPFRVALKNCRMALRADATVRDTIPRRPRLAYREVASSTNRWTLIAAVVPAESVTTHTVFCLKTPLSLASQRVLCVLLNSFIANYLVRMRVGTHVTAAIMSRLRVPWVEPRSADFTRLLELSRQLSEGDDDVETSAAFVDAQALTARMYGLGEDDFAWVLSTFPLVPQETRARCLQAFRLMSDATVRNAGSPAPGRPRPDGRSRASRASSVRRRRWP